MESGCLLLPFFLFPLEGQVDTGPALFLRAFDEEVRKFYPFLSLSSSRRCLLGEMRVVKAFSFCHYTVTLCDRAWRGTPPFFFFLFLSLQQGPAVANVKDVRQRVVLSRSWPREQCSR